jgi:MFS transporter, ACS family, tartrate transporter
VASDFAQTVAQPGTLSEIERRTMRKVMWRLIPVLIICYFVAFVDRTNVSFAGLLMNKELGFSSAVYGLGAGIFFWGYCLFEIPSNLILARVGARVWIARILITWGIISGLTAAVWSAYSFYGIRFLLGVAESGFYPGIILYLTWWFPKRYRARAIGLFMTAIAGSQIVGSIVSGELLKLDGIWGLAGWQWLFILEAIPAVILGIVVYFALTDSPAQAHWLHEDERNWLMGRLTLERQHQEAIRHFELGQALRNPRMWAFTLVYFGQNFTGYGLSLFLPEIMRRLGVSLALVGWVTAIPSVFGLVAMLLSARYADRTGNRVLTVGTACFVSFAGLALCAATGNPVVLFALIVFAALGQNSIGNNFWPLPTAMLSGTAAAGAIALINSLGNLGGFFGPYVVGLIRGATGNFTLALLALSAGALMSCIMVFILGHDRRLEHVPAELASHAD